MKLENNLWSRIKWLVDVWRDLKRNMSWKTVAGSRLIVAALSVHTLGLVVRLILPQNLYISVLEISYDDIPFLVSFLSIPTFMLGCFLVITDVRQESKAARNVARVVINGLPDTPIKFPDEILSRSEQRLARETIELSFCDENIPSQIKRYNAEVCVELFKRFVLNHQCQKLYIGGLARIPFLVAYGKFLRNTSNIYYFDKVHRTANWRLLDDEDLDVCFVAPEVLPNANQHGDVGIALAFSTNIERSHVPIHLVESTVFIQPAKASERNLVLNQANLQRLSDQVRKIIDALSTKSDVKRIHMFLSVQSSFAIEIGRKYQEGVHKPWVIHNFNAATGNYEWALQLTKSEISAYRII